MAKKSKTPLRTKPAATSRVPALDKSWRILEYVASHPDATVGELSSTLGISKSTVSDIVQALCEVNALVRSSSDPRLRLGSLLVAMGTSARRQMPERRAVREILRDLASEWNCNVLVVQLLDQSFTFVIVESIPAPGPNTLVAPVGTQLNFSAPAIGRAYLAGLSEEAAKEFVKRWRAHTAVEADLKTFLSPVAAARKAGFATTVGEYLPENNAAAVPVMDVRGQRVKYVLVLAGYPRQLPSDRLSEAGRALVQIRTRLSDLNGM